MAPALPHPDPAESGGTTPPHDPLRHAAPAPHDDPSSITLYRTSARITIDSDPLADSRNDPATRETADFAPQPTQRLDRPDSASGPASDPSSGPRTLGPSPQATVIPKRLGAVQLIRQVGEGGMGVVWLGRHELLNRDVAVKFLLNITTGNTDPGFVAFVEGARAAAALRHQGLNAVLHADVVEGVPYLVMEYVEGPTLSRVLRSASQLTPACARVVLDQVCGAIAELHDHNVIHRDIKPANILFTTDAKPVVTDFGLACERSLAGFGSSTANIAGTPEYMAPEMFEQTISSRTDVYALGILAYELFAGAPPFRGTLDEIRSAHAATPLPVDGLAKAPDPVAQVIDRATNKNPMYRYKSARHLQRAFDEAFASVDPTIANKALGETELARLVNRLLRGSSEPDAAPITPAITPHATYYDRLSSLRDVKKVTRESGDPITPEDLVVRVEEELRCARCNALLKGVPLTGRCPECLLLVRVTMDRASGAQSAPPASGFASPSASGMAPSRTVAPSPPGAVPAALAPQAPPQDPQTPKRGAIATLIHDFREFVRQFFAK
mgnify:CR=1 FL=1